MVLLRFFTRVLIRVRLKSRRILWWSLGWAIGFDKLSLERQLWLLEPHRYLGKSLLQRFAPERDLLKLELRLCDAHLNGATALWVMAWLLVHLGRAHQFPLYLRMAMDSGSLNVASLRACFSRCSDVMHYSGNFGVAEEIEISTKSQIDCLLNREAGLLNETAHFSAIGHIALLEYLTKAIRLRIISADRVSIIFGCYPVANAPYAQLWMGKLKELGVSVSEDPPELSEPNLELWPTYDGYAVGRLRYGFVEQEWDRVSGKPSLELPSDARETAVKALLGTSFDPARWFVGLHLRSGQQPDRELRNSKMSSYREAIESINEAGGQVVLVGDFHGSPKGDAIDLRRQNFSIKEKQSLHLFVWALSRFFIGNLSGGTFPPRTFGTQTLWVDVHPVAHFRPPHPKDMFVPKLVFSKSTMRILSLAEMYSSEHSSSQTESPKFAWGNGYKIRDSEGGEIRDAVNDMLREGTNRQQLSPLDELVNRAAAVRGLELGARIAPSFLRKWSSELFPSNGL